LYHRNYGENTPIVLGNFPVGGREAPALIAWLIWPITIAYWGTVAVTGNQVKALPGALQLIVV
jgi:hypothetical protein